ncbi:MAG: hypothetical protein ABSD51_14150, partial [Candidatus Binatus sp.]
ANVSAIRERRQRAEAIGVSNFQVGNRMLGRFTMLAVILLLLPGYARAAGQLCTIVPDKGTLVIEVGKMNEFLGLA